MIGPLALHGGGEFLVGDEPFLRALLDLAAVAAAGRTAAAGGDVVVGSGAAAGPDAAARRDSRAVTVRVELLTTAVARHRPNMAFAVGSAAFEQVAAEGRLDRPPLRVRHARVVDAASAADPDLVERLAAADLVYLPGGDPDAVLEILAGTPAWLSVGAARARGAVVAGASAGAMVLGERTWTRTGYVAGFGWAGRLLVVPHASAERMGGMRRTVDALPLGAELAILGLPERAGVTGGAGTWTVVGDAGAWWWPPHAAAPRHEPPGSTIDD